MRRREGILPATIASAASERVSLMLPPHKHHQQQMRRQMMRAQIIMQATLLEKLQQLTMGTVFTIGEVFITPFQRTSRSQMEPLLRPGNYGFVEIPTKLI